MNDETKIPLKNSIATKMLLVVLGLYLLVATTVTLNHIWMEYKYRKANIIHDLEDIESAFEDGLSVSLWGLDQRALRASVEGMLKVPALVGVTIKNDEGIVIASGGVVTKDGVTRNVGLQVDIFGINNEIIAVSKNELYKFEMFQHQFPITYNSGINNISFGQATIYSNSSVIYRGMKLQIVLLVINVVITLLTFFCFPTMGIQPLLAYTSWNSDTRNGRHLTEQPGFVFP